MTECYTENFGDFGSREIVMLKDILTAWVDNGLPEGFSDEQIRPAMNVCSGHVFLVNEDYQVAMMNDDQLELFHTLPYSGHEGFLSDLIAEYSPDELNQEDVDYILNAAEVSGIDLMPPWSDDPVEYTLH